MVIQELLYERSTLTAWSLENGCGWRVLSFCGCYSANSIRTIRTTVYQSWGEWRSMKRSNVQRGHWGVGKGAVDAYGASREKLAIVLHDNLVFELKRKPCIHNGDWKNDPKAWVSILYYCMIDGVLFWVLGFNFVHCHRCVVMCAIVSKLKRQLLPWSIYRFQWNGLWSLW